MPNKSGLPPISRRFLLSLAGILLPTAALGAWLCGNRHLARLAFITSNALLLYPTLKRNSSAFGPVFTQFDTSSKEVWLTIDDGPDPVDTPAILSLLKSYNAKASFFCIGKKATQHRGLCRKIVREGHTLENHSQDHPVASFWSLPPSLMQRQIEDGSHAILTATGIAPRFFRSPVGMTNPFVHPALEKNQLKLVGWSCAGFDGVNRSTEDVLKCLLPKVRPGAIILLHEGTQLQTPSNRVHTLQLLLQYLQLRGYTCIIPAMDSLKA
ncbi:MAG: polysaccharide deacetylase family protein [Chthoniobacterales bacterium]